MHHRTEQERQSCEQFYEFGNDYDDDDDDDGNSRAKRKKKTSVLTVANTLWQVEMCAPTLPDEKKNQKLPHKNKNMCVDCRSTNTRNNRHKFGVAATCSIGLR